MDMNYETQMTYCTGINRLCTQGLYRLAEMIEDGFRFAITNSTLTQLKVPASEAANNVTLLLHLYSR